MPTTGGTERAGTTEPPRRARRTNRPTSPAYATQLRLIGRQLVARINGKLGRTLVRDLRVLTPRTIAATGPDQRTEHHQAVEQPEAPVRTRNDASPGFHRALAEIRRTTSVIDPAITGAIDHQTQFLLDHREPWDLFAQGLTEKADQEKDTARTAAATSSQAIAERRARADRAARTAAVPLRPAQPPITLSGAA
ncbi:hypothetical protein [Kitasatospora purpeofusca]|uniref:hypothetical protein n=1 Tax=Kitasatospora purpeofusca TaxID=67352 RepID=UPI0035DDB0F7